MNVAVAATARIDAAWRALAAVPDPEVPAISIVELGIVRGVAEADDGALEVALTPTYSGCPATEVIEASVHDALAPLGLVRVRRQRAPAWTTDWISDEGRRKLREYGIAPPGAALPSTSSGRSEARGERWEALHRIPVRAELVEALVACPRCGSTHTERLSAFGATACKSLHRCLDCREPFEHFKPL